MKDLAVSQAKGNPDAAAAKPPAAAAPAPVERTPAPAAVQAGARRTAVAGDQAAHTRVDLTVLERGGRVDTPAGVQKLEQQLKQLFPNRGVHRLERGQHAKDGTLSVDPVRNNPSAYEARRILVTPNRNGGWKVQVQQTHAGKAGADRR